MIADLRTAVQRNTALELLATARVAARAPEARETLDLLFQRDPGHRLTDPNVSPSLFAAFSRAREAATGTVSVQMTHDPPTTPSRRQGIAVDVDVTKGLNAVHVIRLSHRDGSGPYVRTEMRMGSDGTAHARIPVRSHDETTSVDYYFEALAPSMALLGSHGSVEEPFQVTVSADADLLSEPEESVGAADAEGAGLVDDEASSSGWWVWALVAVLAIGAGVAIGVGVWAGSQSEAPPQGTLGTFEL